MGKRKDGVKTKSKQALFPVFFLGEEQFTGETLKGEKSRRKKTRKSRNTTENVEIRSIIASPIFSFLSGGGRIYRGNIKKKERKIMKNKKRTNTIENVKNKTEMASPNFPFSLSATPPPG